MPIDQPPPIIGQASVIDGDTIEIHGIRIRLNGIDAPESRQLCRTNQGQNYRCGQQAALYLSDLIANHTITCNPIGLDRYQRTIAICYIGSIDIQARMVETGQALAFVRYSKRYIEQEETAKQLKHGLWQGEFTMPWDWRKGD